MPLCTIFTKWPAPGGPTCANPSAGASASNDGLHDGDGFFGAADHQAEAVLETPDAAAHAGVDERDRARLQRRGAADAVGETRVAAVDDDVARRQQRR